VPNIIGLGMFKKTAPHQSWHFAWYSVKIRVIFGARFETR